MADYIAPLGSKIFFVSNSSNVKFEQFNTHENASAVAPWFWVGTSSNVTFHSGPKEKKWIPGENCVF